MNVLSGLDVVVAEDLSRLRGQSIGLVTNQAAIDSQYRHILDIFIPFHQRGELNLAAVFGPEHGLFGHTQDNMIEWEGLPDPRTGVVVHSLYGEHRRPVKKMMAGVERFVIDLPDIGSRYYTFAWTMAHCLEAAVEFGVPVTILDRPNPIGGTITEGPVLEMPYSSFVGLYPVPTRHGLTLGEIARFVNEFHLGGAVDLEIIEAQGWDRAQYQDETGLPWAMPSPNMPSVQTAAVYPGGCLLEGTNLSEGRGTTRPFEIFGAPFLHGWKLAEALNRLELPGVIFRPLPFEPTFNKHARQLCEGCFVHVTDRRTFEPVLAYVAILQECLRQTGLHDSSSVTRPDVFQANSTETGLGGFAWKQPPYEYVNDRMPIDILAGNGWLRGDIENLTPLAEIRERFRTESTKFVQATLPIRGYAQ